VPVNSWAGMEDCLSSIVECEPAAVLVSSSESGLWGCLLRQYLDVDFGRIRPEEWQTRIDAVEIDPARVQPYARRYFTEIVIGDLREVVPRRAAEIRYDVILFGDVIEDLYKDDGRALLEAAAALVGRRLVVRIQLADDWLSSGAGSEHLSYWYAKDFIDRTFAGHSCRLREYDLDTGPYAMITIQSDRQ